ncbi:MAG: hydroxysqualene dehydroxylase HpnE [Planctomycetes bacterium]|nr:hydroxysqualene dehydroxylase HpnE [Planctomycetota bacterium]MBU4398545.1 hydroxysqualene dehydroxylase HpnE [Planctomycetota bacterium]
MNPNILDWRGSSAPTVAVVGGGLAGMAAALAAAERGFQVELFERAKTLGGRAGSFVDPKIDEPVDYCQHVAMGCCSALLDFCRRAGIDDCFQRTRTLHFIGPDGDRRDFTPCRWLPTPLYLLPGLLRLKYLSLGERWNIVRALRKLCVGWVKRSAAPPKVGKTWWGCASLDPPYFPKAPGYYGEEETVGHWLRRHGQSQRAIDRFWSVVLVGALAETVEHASLAAARKVFRDGFLASRDASDLLLPRLPLGEIFNDRLGERLANRGVKVHLNTPVRRIEGDRQLAGAVVPADGERRKFDYFVAAVPWHNVRPLLADELLSAIPTLENVEKIGPAAITAVHLWFDRPVVPLPHAVLVGRLSQWVFADEQTDSTSVQHCQVVISASHRLERRNRDELLDDVRGELQSVWPAVGGAELLHSRIIAQPAAVFSCLPGVDRFRPQQKTPIRNLALAGDWTDTGWPATMESAVRSGYRAVNALACRSQVPYNGYAAAAGQP